MPRARERHVFVDEVDGNLSTGGTSGPRQRPARIAVEIAARRCGSGRDVLEALPDPSLYGVKTRFLSHSGAPITDPAGAGSRVCARARGRRPCPVVAILLEGKKKGRRAHRGPQRPRITAPYAVSPAKPCFLGCRKGSHDGDDGPRGAASRAIVRAAAVLLGEGHAPVVPVLLVPARTTWPAESGN
jgi:hypothetical protein